MFLITVSENIQITKKKRLAAHTINELVCHCVPDLGNRTTEHGLDLISDGRGRYLAL